MGEGRGVAGRAEARRQAVSLGCVVSAGHLAYHVGMRSQFETDLKDVQSLPCNYGHWLVWLLCQKCVAAVCHLINPQRGGEDAPLAGLALTFVSRNAIALEHGLRQNSSPKYFRISPFL